MRAVTTYSPTPFRYSTRCICCGARDVALRLDPDCEVHQAGRVYQTYACRDCAPGLWMLDSVEEQR